MKHSDILTAESVIELPPVLSFIVGARVAPRSSVEALIEAAINALDKLDGDPDEDTGDAEDELLSGYASRYGGSGAGCIVSDVGEEDDDPGQNDEDEVTSGLYSYGWFPSGPGCLIADPDQGPDGA